MRGKELLNSALDGEDVSNVLSNALRQHILTGESLDDLLGLRSNGGPTPRRQLLLLRRGASLLEAYSILKKAKKLSDRQTALLLHDTLLHPGCNTIEELTPVLDAIQFYTDILGIKVSSGQALYNCILSLQCIQVSD